MPHVAPNHSHPSPDQPTDPLLPQPPPAPMRRTGPLLRVRLACCTRAIGRVPHKLTAAIARRVSVSRAGQEARRARGGRRCGGRQGQGAAPPVVGGKAQVPCPLQPAQPKPPPRTARRCRPLDAHRLHCSALCRCSPVLRQRRANSAGPHSTLESPSDAQRARIDCDCAASSPYSRT
jgi:hypothetical protein